MKKGDMYVKIENFKDFCINQEKLIDILNHRMTKMEDNVNKMVTSVGILRTDINWMKKLTWVIVGLLITIAGTSIIKLIGG